MADDDLAVMDGLVIPAHELDWRFTTSSGPGGQHANRSNTRAEVRWNVVASGVLADGQRARLVDRLGPVVTVSADDERSQKRNRDLARRRLAERVRSGLHREPPRRATRPTRGSRERRLESKRQRSEVKRGRGRIRPDD